MDMINDGGRLFSSKEEQYEAILQFGLDNMKYCAHISQDDIDRLNAPGHEVIWAYNSGWYTERDMSALVKIDGGYAVFHEGEDYTGHGCQCNGDVVYFKTLDEAIRLGLTDEDRDRYFRKPEEIE